MRRGQNTAGTTVRSPSLFTDSEGEDKIIGKRKLPTRERALSPKTKVKKFLDEQLQHGDLDLFELAKVDNEEEMKYGDNNKQDKKDDTELFLPPPTTSSSRKRAHGEQSKSRTSSVAGKNGPSSSKGMGLDDSFCSDFYSDDDFGSVSVSGRSKVSELIGRLGTEIQQKVRAKKQKLAEQFKNVNAIPLNFHHISARHAEERQKLVDILRAESEKVQERMENMIHLGTVQYEKHEQSMQVINQGSEAIRKAIENIVNMQSALYTKFTEDLKNFDEKHTHGLKDLSQMCEHSLRELHNKLKKEIVQTETETLANVKV